MKEIPLTQGKVALVDDADFEELSQYKWFAVNTRKAGTGAPQWYAARSFRTNAKKILVYMHRCLLNACGAQVDHWDGNGLNNQRGNLRVASRLQNNANKKLSVKNISGLKGVSWDRKCGKWKAQATGNGKDHHLGYFNHRVEAGEAYDRKAMELHGNFAMTNRTLGLLPPHETQLELLEVQSVA